MRHGMSLQPFHPLNELAHEYGIQDWVISPSLQKDFKKFVDSCEVALDASRFFKHITEESFLWRRSGSLEKAVVD